MGLDRLSSCKEGALATTQTIEETAGAVRQYLKDHGKSTVKAVKKGVEAPVDAVPRAVGWLAQEGKVDVALEKQTLCLWLMENRTSVHEKSMDARSLSRDKE